MTLIFNHDAGGGLSQGRSDGGVYRYIPPKLVYLKFFYVIVMSP